MKLRCLSGFVAILLLVACASGHPPKEEGEGCAGASEHVGKAGENKDASPC